MKELKNQVDKLSQELLSNDTLAKVQIQANSILEDLRKSADLIPIAQGKLGTLRNKHSASRCQPDLFLAAYGDVIQSIEKNCCKNHKDLKFLETGLLLNCDEDPLLLDVQALQRKNKTASKDASILCGLFYDYRCRCKIEISWLSEMAERFKIIHKYLSVTPSDIINMQLEIVELQQVLKELMCRDQSSQDFDQQVANLCTLLMLDESIRLLSKDSSLVQNAVADLCYRCENLGNLVRKKSAMASRFYRYEVAVRRDSQKTKIQFDELEESVNTAKEAYAKKMRLLFKDGQVPDTRNFIYKKVTDVTAFSWRNRLHNGRCILPAMRTQARGECAYVASVSATESLYKKRYADQTTLGGETYQPSEFVLKLSANHLQDIVREFYDRRPEVADNKLQVCLDRMKHEGVIVEDAYNSAKKKIEDYRHYRLRDFDELNIADSKKACRLLEDGTVLIGNFKITTDYYRLGPEDIYEIPPGAIFETTPTGKTCSHCVVIVGFGTVPDGRAYYLFQNSYGPSWGSDGYGRVYCDSVKRLYSATL